MNNNNSEQHLRFTVDKILWQNEDGEKKGKNVSQWKLMLCQAECTDDFPDVIKADSDAGKIKCFVSGDMNKPEYDKQKFHAVGGWVYSSTKKNWSFKANFICTELPTEREDIVVFLRHCGAKVGAKNANAIVDTFGCDLSAIAEQAEEIAATIKGVSLKGARKIAEKISFIENTTKLTELLKSAGVEYSSIVKIAKEYGDAALEIVKSNPYQMWREVGFTTCDRIFLGFNGEINDEIRLIGAIWSQYGACKGRDASIMVEEGKLVQTTLQALNRAEVVEKVYSETVHQTLQKMVANYVAIKGVMTLGNGAKQTFIYCKEDFVSERDLANKTALFAGQSVLNEPATIFEAAVDKWQENGITLSGKQKEAVRVAARNPVTVITGGPGTGKTTCLRAIIECYKKAFPDAPVTLMAPTGLAAHRMTSATGHEANTVHKALGLVPAKSISGFSQAGDADELSGLVVVDESSMLGIHLARFLMESIVHCDATRIVFVGDIDQLPPVSQGNFFEDLIYSEIVPVTRLDRNFRQEAGSTIIDAAYAINSGNPRLKYTDDFSFIPCQEDGMVQKIVEEFTSSVQEYGLAQTFVLTPTHKKGALSTNEINPVLQDLVNPEAPGKQSCHRGSIEYRVGDRVICTKNGNDVVNGDIGNITAISVGESGDTEVTVKFDSCSTVFTKDNLNWLELAYAITVHKSQGCEFSSIILPASQSQEFMMVRNLFYTAVTRAKKKVTIVGQESIVTRAVTHVPPKTQKSLLCLRLRKYAAVLKKS